MQNKSEAKLTFGYYYIGLYRLELTQVTLRRSEKNYFYTLDVSSIDTKLSNLTSDRVHT